MWPSLSNSQVETKTMRDSVKKRVRIRGIYGESNISMSWIFIEATSGCRFIVREKNVECLWYDYLIRFNSLQHRSSTFKEIRFPSRKYLNNSFGVLFQFQKKTVDNIFKRIFRLLAGFYSKLNKAIKREMTKSVMSGIRFKTRSPYTFASEASAWIRTK